MPDFTTFDVQLYSEGPRKQKYLENLCPLYRFLLSIYATPWTVLASSVVISNRILRHYVSVSVLNRVAF